MLTIGVSSGNSGNQVGARHTTAATNSSFSLNEVCGEQTGTHPRHKEEDARRVVGSQFL